MGYAKKDFMVSRFANDSSPLSRDSMCSDDSDNDEFPSQSSLCEADFVNGFGDVKLECDDDDDNGDDADDDEGEEEEEEEDEDDVDSGAGSDDFDYSELGEIGTEFCQVGDRTCCLPFELFDLPDLTDILSVDTWNNCLTEEERLGIAEYLPDMDQLTFNQTLKELFGGGNFHFGSPLSTLFGLLKEGLCDPRVALLRQGFNFFEKCRHYHLLRQYQNSMVGSIVQIRDAWGNCAAYSIEEKLRLLNILRSKKNLMYEGDNGFRAAKDSFLESRLGSKSNCRARSKARPSLDVSLRGRGMILEPVKHKKPNLKGVLKVVAPKATSKKTHAPVVGHFSAANHGLKKKPRPSSSLSSLLPDQMVRYNMETAWCPQGLIRADDYYYGVDDDYEEDRESEEAYDIGIKKNWSTVNGVEVSKNNLSKPEKRQGVLKRYPSDYCKRLDGEDTESSIKIQNPKKSEHFSSLFRNKDAKMVGRTGKLANARDESGRRIQYVEELPASFVEQWADPTKDHSQGNRSTSCQHFQHGKEQEEAFSMYDQLKYDDWKFRTQEWKTGDAFKTGKRNAGVESKLERYKFLPTQMGESYFQSDVKARKPENLGRKLAQNGGFKVDPYFQTETESDSSEWIEKDNDINHLARKLGYRGGFSEDGVSLTSSGADAKGVNNLVRKVKKEYSEALHETLQPSKKGSSLGEQSTEPEIEIFSSKGKKRGMMSGSGLMQEFYVRVSPKRSSTSSKLANDNRIKSMKNSHIKGDPSERLKVPSGKACSNRKLKGKKFGSNSMHGNASVIFEPDNPCTTTKSMAKQVRDDEFQRKGQMTEVPVATADLHEGPAMALSGCSDFPRRWKGKVDIGQVDGSEDADVLQCSPQQPNGEPVFVKKRMKKKANVENSHSPMVSSDVLMSNRGMVGLDAETKPQKKPFTLITPTVHTGFSFSIIRLLTAVRIAMITIHADVLHAVDASEVGKYLEKTDEGDKAKEDGHENEGSYVVPHSNEHQDARGSEHKDLKNVPALTVKEIVDCVKSNPRDPCILETQEPLQDLVRGVLKIFSSKTAPLGAKGWKALALYEKSTKRWSWVGPISCSSDHETVVEETSPEAWGLPHKMLVKLVDSFANWLKHGQETLKLMGSLPPPPQPTANFDEKERFRDLRAQRSCNTITPSSDEVRAYFRQEEFLRYSIQDRAFSYTAADGKKSIVAPLRRCGSKPTSKARDHFLLKPDRPAHVTILSLVRDAAARLPGSIGTRADVCTLLRDSQYVVEDVSDTQINTVVSGALDRLHYERDPCVQFDGERKFWVYLHRDREEEDFEDDGTSSTKKWKRPRKDPTDRSENVAAIDMAYQGTGNQAAGGSVDGYDLGSEFIIELSSTYAGEKTELVYNDSRPIMAKMEPLFDSVGGIMHKDHPMGWEILDTNHLGEGKLLCQENPTNKDFDNETKKRGSD